MFSQNNNGGYMKKIFIILIILIVMSGCSLNINNIDNTPTKQVEKYLNNYQKLTDDVVDDLELVIEKEKLFNKDQKNMYKDIMKRNFQNMVYTIKDETVNGNNAMVEVEITVYDHYKVIKLSDNYLNNHMSEFLKDDGTLDLEKFTDYKLKNMKKNTDKVKYTIYFNLTRDKNNKWKVDEVSEFDEEKILGIYEY